MANLFYENQLRLVEQRRWLKDHRDFLAALRNPELEPLTDLPLEGFTAYETPQEVASYVIERSAEHEAAFQLLITTNALEKIQAAMAVVLLQKALTLQISPDEQDVLSACLDMDQAQIGTMFLKASQAVAKARQNSLLEDTIQGHLMPLFSTVTAQFEDVAHGQIKEDILFMDGKELIESIGEKRLEAVQLVLEANEEHFRKANRLLNEAAYLIKARDENIIPESSYLQEEIESRLGQSDGILSKCHKRIQSSQKYMETIYDMGHDTQQLDKFLAIHYNAAPLRNLFEITP